MFRQSVVLAALALIGSPIHAQSPDDAQTSKMMLAEIRQLRQDLGTVSIAVQRIQILLFRIQVQEIAVNRATQRAEEARQQAQNIQSMRQSFSGQVHALETQLSTSSDASQHAQVADALAGAKTRLEEIVGSESEAQRQLIDAESQLRTEQARRDELHDMMNRIDQTLAAGARPAGQ